jgi:ParB-like chromosome segregation protein Spo0J
MQSQPTLFPVPVTVVSSAEVPTADLPEVFLGKRPDPAFVDSVRSCGILCPVLLAADEDGNGYTVLDGRRRVMAAHLVGLPTVPARCVTIDGTDHSALLGVVANRLRSPNPATELATLAPLLREFDLPSLARQLGIPLTQLRKLAKLGGLCPPLRDALATGLIALGPAERAAGLPHTAQVALLAVLEANGRILARDVASVAEARKQDATTTLSFLDGVNDPIGTPYTFDWRRGASAHLTSALTLIPPGTLTAEEHATLTRVSAALATPAMGA